MPQTPRNSAGNYAEFLSGHKPDCNNFSVFPLYSRQAMLISRLFNRFLNLGIIPRNSAKSRNNSNYPEILCAGHSQTVPTVAPILTAAPYRNTLLKTYKIDTGAHRCAPCSSPFRNPLSLFPAHTPSPSPRIPERLLIQPYRCDFACKRMVWRTLWANMTRVRWAGLPPRLALRQAGTG